MPKYHAINERIKRKYFTYLQEARRYSVQTVDITAKALARFEEYNNYRDFKTFNPQQAVAFKKHLAQQKALLSGEKLSKATLHGTLANLKHFFQWLSGQAGYKTHFNYLDADYFNLSENEVRVATARRPQKAPTMEQVRHVILTMPCQTDIEQRNRALIAFTLLTGARDSAIASMQLKHVDLQHNSVFQDARTVRTKFSKTFTTYFLPVGEDVLAIFTAWVKYLREVKLCSEDDALFPATRIACNTENRFAAAGLDDKGWSSAAGIRKIFKEAFEGCDLPYFNPHSLRHTLVKLGQTMCNTPEAFKAWSQNLGHEKVLTTFYNYGEVATDRQQAIILGLKQDNSKHDASELEQATELIRIMKAREL